MNDYELDQIAKSYAEDIAAEVKEHGGEPRDLAYEYVDGSEHVIYYSKAHDICQHCNTELGEDFFEEMGGPGKGATYNSIATHIAFGELLSRVESELNKLNVEG